MDATQIISDSILESEEEENEEENETKRGRPLAKLRVLKNAHIPETELPLFLGENVVGRDPNTCTVPLPAPSISKQHATVCISVFRRRGVHNEVDIEALVWDLGSMNGTRKGRLKLTPNVRYALSECDSLVVADIPCQYVSCTVDADSSQKDIRTPVSRHSGVNARSPGASGEQGGGTSTDGKKCVNGGAEAGVSLPDQRDKRKTPVRGSCLSFEQTPTQPEGTLVPESDSDSDGERGDRRRKALVSDSDSHKSSPTCSTFLSPANKIVPESEDESPITPSSSTKNRPCRHVSFSTEETDEDAGRQQLENKKTLAIVDDSEEEEERAALGGRKSEECGGRVPVKQDSNVSLELPVSSPAVFTDAIPAFDMDSDTDVEGEEELTSAGPVTLNANQQADQLPNTAQFHMDSDTDVDEDDETSHKVPEPVPPTTDPIKPPHVIPVVQPEGITMDSDTDVDDDDAVSDAAFKAKPTSLQSTRAADSSSIQLSDLQLDSDTDVDEEEENEHATNNVCSKIDEAPTRSDIKPAEPESNPAAPHSLHLDSDTDDEAVPAPVTVVPAVTELLSTADALVDLGVLSDIDTDVENDSRPVVPASAGPSTTSEAFQADSDADTDVDEASVPPAGDVVNPPDLRADSDTDVEDQVDFGHMGEGQIPSLHRENTPGLLVPLQQNCSTPLQASEGELAAMDTQQFLSPSSVPFRYPAAGAIALSSCSDIQEEDFTVAETQSFILKTRERQENPLEDLAVDPSQSYGDESSFQLGLSDSSHLEGQAQALAMESTQAFVPVVDLLNLEDTQAYADRSPVENDSNVEASEEDKEPARCSGTSAKQGQVDFALEATQAYTSGPHSDSEEETDEDEGKTTATADTQLFHLDTSSTLAIAATQPMPAFEEEEEEEEVMDEDLISSAFQVSLRPQDVTEEHGEAALPHRRHMSEALSVAPTQPMCVSDDQESVDEDAIPGKRKTQEQTPTNSELALLETQPMFIHLAETQLMHSDVAETQPMTGEDVANDDGELISGPRKRKAKQLHLEDEQTQESSAVEAQPTDKGEGGESDEDDSILGPRKRRAKTLQVEDETQSLTGSQVLVVETQPMVAFEGEQSDEDESNLDGRKRRAKVLPLGEELIQTPTNSDLSLLETQPMHIYQAETQPMTREEVQHDDGELISGPCKRKEKQLHLEDEQTQEPTNSEFSAVEPQLTDKGECGDSDEDDPIPGPRKKKAKPLQVEDETQSLTGSQVLAVETQPMGGCEHEQSDEEDTVLVLRKRRAKVLPLEEELTQTPTNSDLSLLETQPGGGESDEDDSNVGQRRRRVKALQLEDSESQPSVSAVETQPVVCGENKESDEESVPGPRKRRAKPSHVEEDETQPPSTVETTRRCEASGSTTAGRRETRARLREEQEQACSDPARRQTRSMKTSTTRRRRGKPRHEEEDSEEEEDVEQDKQTRGRKPTRQQKDNNEEKRETERSDRNDNNNLLKHQEEREEQERLERERKEIEEQERLRLDQERAENEQIEKQRMEEEEKKRAEEEKEKQLKDRKDKEEKERLEREKAERKKKERIEKERKEKEEKERLEREKAEREEKERIEKERLKREQEERFKKEREEQEHQTRLEREAKEREERERLDNVKQEKDAKEKQIKEENLAKTPARSRRAARRTFVEQDDDDVPARRTRSRSNSSNSVSSERSASSVNTQGGRGRGRGTGATRAQQDSHDVSLSRSNSTNSLNSEISSCSVSSQGIGRGGRQRGRGRKTEAEPGLPTSSHSDPSLTPKPPARGRRSRKPEELSNQVTPADSLQAGATRGRLRANASGPSPQECGSEESPLPQRTARGRGQKVKSETVEVAVAPPVGAEKRNGRKRELEAEEEASSSSNMSKEASEETKDEVQTKRRGRAPTAQAKKNTQLEVKEESEGVEVGTGGRRGRGRTSVAQKTKTQDESGTSVDQDPHVEISQTPTSSVSRKRLLPAPADSSPTAKTPRSSFTASPAASGRLRAASQMHKVLFTGVVDEDGERVLARLGGSVANSVADMNCLVTDKVRRTVKFLCALAKGVPIVTTHWLEKSGQAGSFLSPNAFLVEDPEQEKKFNFCLQDSLRIASNQPLLQGYKIHVTKSVKPEPVYMKDIISCSGATYLAKMPSANKPQTAVISCEDDWPLCRPALSASLPVVTAEFILTGILQQKLDLQAHALSAPANAPQPAGGRGRSRKKT